MNLQANPLVTVYITNYNYDQYLEQAIQSVLDQIFQDFELLIIDDGSTDNSMEIIKRFEKLQNVFVILQKNKGLTVSNNIALKMARGKYFMRLDADDYLDPHCMEIMISKMEKQLDLALVFPDYYEVGHSGKILNHIRRHDFSKDVTLFDQPAHGACSMIRTKTLREVGGYDESFDRQDGYDLWLKMIDGYEISNINLPLFYYRRHGDNLSADSKELLKTRADIKKKRIKEKKFKPISVLAVIPTRGSKMDSRSIPLRKLGGKNLIDWTIDTALETRLLDNIIVTTPDKDVIDHVSTKYSDRVLTIVRPEELARININFELTILHALEKYESDYSSVDAIMVLSIDYPFKASLYLEKAIHTLQLYDVDAVRSVIVDDSNFYEHDGSGLRPHNKNKLLRLERNLLFRGAGGIQLFRYSAITGKKFPTSNVGHITLDQKAAFELNSEFNWVVAQSFCKD